MKQILLLIAVGAVLGAAGNAVSPRGLSWSRPLGRGVGPDVVRAGLVPIDLASAKELVTHKQVTFVDARTPEDYAIGRLPRAIRWTPGMKLPQEGRVVVYCANEFCDSALKVGEELKNAGRRDVAVFVDGYEAWWNAGEAVEQD